MSLSTSIVFSFISPALRQFHHQCRTFLSLCIRCERSPVNTSDNYFFDKMGLFMHSLFRQKEVEISKTAKPSHHILVLVDLGTFSFSDRRGLKRFRQKNGGTNYARKVLYRWRNCCPYPLATESDSTIKTKEAPSRASCIVVNEKLAARSWRLLKIGMMHSRDAAICKCFVHTVKAVIVSKA